MSAPTNKKAYQRHEYSGPRKSSKRVKNGLKKFHGEDVQSRQNVWRAEEMEKPKNVRKLKAQKAEPKPIPVLRQYAGPLKCKKHSDHTPQIGRTKIIIANVYHYFEREYEELKKTIKGIDQTPLSKFRQRTALATGVSEATVVEILREEARWHDDMRQRQTEWTKMVVIKEEPLELYKKPADSISIDVKIEPHNEEATTPQLLEYSEMKIEIDEEGFS